ncbi:hypothetical protein QBC46DRAFT_377086 [Diplogelasinospora grovesii]|uniref:Uncharacterized protein n=1 Tax=Diplogelasinospora grovesii TaxID=303347 RepID=A0AAN6NDH5_9PEZI|nr:hypothetical protein QBC46DRAFT_377086 [Diplogelasinospora grovesii]
MASRRRQNSAVSGSRSNLPIHTRNASRQVPAAQAKSAHVADPFLRDFLSPSFDAADYLNSTLPPLQAARSSQGAGAVSLAEVSTQAQSTLSQLNAHTTRLTNTLTQLTDDMLRSGSRLAYEVELLRGETLGLAQSLTEGLQEDIVKFVPGGIQEGTSSSDAPAVTATATDEEQTSTTTAPEEPPYISQLRTLTLVRARLDSGIKTFGDAMEFVFPPSELSVSSSFLSVSAPDAGGENHSTEEKGQQVLQAMRDEIDGLLNKNPDPVKGIEDAARRIEELKELNTVWKGTAEEKGRTKFIESLAKMVEDKHRDLLRDMDQSSRRDTGRVENEKKTIAADSDAQAESKGGYGGYGLISQLQKLRNGL